MKALTDLPPVCWVKRSTCVTCQRCTLLGAISAASQSLLGGGEANMVTIQFSTVPRRHGVLLAAPLSSRAEGTGWRGPTLRHTKATARAQASREVQAAACSPRQAQPSQLSSPQPDFPQQPDGHWVTPFARVGAPASHPRIP